MKQRALLIFAIVLTSNYLMGQSIEFGPMINYERTTFSEKNDTNGFETNIALGGYIIRYVDGIFSDGVGYGAELFYLKHTAQGFSSFSTSTINLMPYVNASPFDDFPLFIGFGGGLSYQISNENTAEDFQDDAINKVGLRFRLAISYRIENMATIELGGRVAPTNLVKEDIEETREISLYLSAKLPINQLLKLL